MHLRRRAEATRRRAARAAVRVGKLAPTSVRGRLGRATRPLRRRFRGPLVTVVVAVSDSETVRIDPCLGSACAQTHPNLDVVVVPFGPSTRVRAAAERFAAQDWRVRVLDGRADRAAAWNAGAAAARGRYLVFVRGADDLRRHGVERLLASASVSGSDLVVGRIEPPVTLHASTELPYGTAHQRLVQGTTLARSPEAVTDLGVGNRLFRTDFWRASGLAFDPTDSSGAALALQAYERVSGFDLLREPTYVPTGRREGFSVGAVPDVLADLDRWTTEHERTWDAVAALDMPEVEAWWLTGVLDAAIQPFLADAERATPEQWTRLRDHVRLLLESGGAGLGDRLRVESRIKLWLARADRPEELVDFVTSQLFEKGFPTVVRDGEVLAALPYLDDPEVGLPHELFVLSEAETPLTAILHRIGWPAPDLVELDVFARIERVDLAEGAEVQAWLVERGGDARHELAVEPRPDIRANTAQGSRHHDYRNGAVRILVDLAPLADRCAEEGTETAWELELAVTARGVVRRGPLTQVEDRGSAGMVETGHLGTRRVGGSQVSLVGRFAHSFSVVVRPDDGAARLVSGEASGLVVSGVLQPGSAPVRAVQLRDALGVVRGRTERRGDQVAFRVEVPRRLPGEGSRRWRLEVETASGDQGVAWPADTGQWIGGPDAAVALSRSHLGEVAVVDALGVLVVESVTHRSEEAELVVTGRWLGRPPVRSELRLAGAHQTVVAEQDEADGVVTARFRTRWDPWGRGEVAIPVGRYFLELTYGPASRPLTGLALLGEKLLDRLMEESSDDTYRLRAIRRGREAGVVLQPPLPPEDRGPFAQARLQQWYRDCDLPLDDRAVYLQAYTGGPATDSQLAIHHELRRRHPDKVVYWGVADRESAVPEGGVPLIMHSSEWYRVLATARHLSLNIDPDRWFRTRPGQQLLQTFHGYPAKSMGIRMWESKGYTPRRIDLELARTSGNWTLILTPSPEMDEHYRREYRYDGAIHNEGYPRDDALVSPDAAETRERARRALGIEPGRKALLYAPTWRDDLATNWRRAEVTTHLDLESTSRRLGPDWVVLARGHRFHSRFVAGEADRARVVDVTRYPEVNDLILAADVAVLDYSSLRFDFSLTGKPMIFLVPDLGTYTSGVRGFLYPFEESAPGPLLETEGEVVERLKDLAGLEREYADARAEFDRRYNRHQDGHAAERVVEAFFGRP